MKNKIILLLITSIFITCTYTLIPSAKEISTTTPTSTITPQNTTINNIVDLSKIPQKTENIKYENEMADELFNIINSEREKNGLMAFEKDYALQEIANYRNHDMITNNYMSHIKDGENTPERIKLYDLINYNYYGSGENIAAIMYASAQDFFNLWCSDESHKSLLFSSEFNKAGISIAYGYKNCYIATMDIAATNKNNIVSNTITGTSSNISNIVNSSAKDEAETSESNNLYILILLLIALMFITQKNKSLKQNKLHN